MGKVYSIKSSQPYQCLVKGILSSPMACKILVTQKSDFISAKFPNGQKSILIYQILIISAPGS